MSFARYFLIFIFICSDVLAQTNAINESAPLKLLNAEILLVEKRIEILKKNQGQALKSAMDSVAQKKAGSTASTSYFNDLNELKGRLSALNLIKIKHSKQTLNDDSLIGELAKSRRSCDLGGCLRILGIMNQELASRIADVTNTIVIKDWNAFEIISKTSQQNPRNTLLNRNSDDPLEEIFQFNLKSWACERSLGNADANVALDPKKLGDCLVSILGEVSKESGTVLKFSADSTFKVPLDSNLGKLMDKHNRVISKMSRFPDYQMKPWELFKECAREEKSSLREALYLCYEVLRHARMMPEIKRKLLDIRGDRSKGGDNAGDWYHIFGMANAYTWLGMSTKLLYRLAPGTGDASDPLETRNDMIGADLGRLAGVTLKNYLSSLRPIPPSAQTCNPELILLNQK